MITSHHGDPDLHELAALGLDPAAMLDFSVCVNPYGPSPRVQAALAEVAVHAYPDRAATLLRRALADWLAVSPDRILVGNGTSELIWLTCLALLRPEDRVLLPQPTYGEYARSAAIVRARLIPVPAAAEDHFILDPERMHSLLRTWQPRLTFLCNPNNPTGTVLPPERIAGWAEEFPGCVFVVDEAYLPFADEAVGSVLQHRRDNILVLRSMTKDFALAGLRLGFAAAVPRLIEQLAMVQPPWSVNAMAQAAGVAALEDLDHVRSSCQLLRQARRSLCDDLRLVGRKPLDSAGHFFLMNVGNGKSFRRALLERSIVVRDCASFGLPEYVRIAARRPEDNRRLVQAIGRRDEG